MKADNNLSQRIIFAFTWRTYTHRQCNGELDNLRIRNVETLIQGLWWIQTHGTFYLNLFDAENCPFHFYRSQDFPAFRIAIWADKLVTFFICQPSQGRWGIGECLGQVSQTRRKANTKVLALQDERILEPRTTHTWLTLSIPRCTVTKSL